MKYKERIDILIATYNGERFLKEQLDSIINQTYDNLRILISDDCSKDSTCDILKEYQALDNRIEIYYQEKNLGTVQNFEFLLKKVESKYFAFSDQDDIWCKDKIEKSYNKLIEESADLVHSDLKVIDEIGNILYKSRWKKMGFVKKIKYDDIRSVYLYNCITGCTILSKSEFLKYALPLPKKSKFMIHDYWIAIVVALKGKIVHIDEKLICYRQHSNNQIGNNKYSPTLKSFEEVRNLFIQVKLEHFEDYIANSSLFTPDMQKLNKEALDYFKMLKNKKNINFKSLNIYHKLYKYDTFSYYLLQFIILNIPIMGRLGFKIFKLFQSITLKKKGNPVHE